MLVRPGGVAAGSMYHAKNGIRSNKVPRKNGGAAFARVAFQFPRVNRPNPTIYSWRRAAIEQFLVDVDSFIELGGRSCRHGERHTEFRAAPDAVAGRECRWIE